MKEYEVIANNKIFHVIAKNGYQAKTIVIISEDLKSDVEIYAALIREF